MMYIVFYIYVYVKSLRDIYSPVILFIRMLIRVAKSLSVTSNSYVFSRHINCWTAAITKKHRKIYERTYPTVLVFPNGSTINIQYHEPRGIIRLPVDITKLTESERKKMFEKRVPKTTVVIEEDIEDNYDADRYLIYKKQ